MIQYSGLRKHKIQYGKTIDLVDSLRNVTYGKLVENKPIVLQWIDDNKNRFLSDVSDLSDKAEKVKN